MESIYIHIPYCNNICNYCDFFKRIEKDKKMISSYIKNIIEEVESLNIDYSNIKSVYIGGGTPSNLDVNLLKKLLSSVNNLFKNLIEFTIECNPEDVTEDLCKIFKNHGINRISLGVQTFNDNILNYCNRKHNTSISLEALKTLNSYFDNINIDMIYNLPTQSINDLKNDLKIIKDLNIKHISYYSFIFENKSIFGKKLSPIANDASDKIEIDMYNIIIKRLSDLKFNRYEVSNYSQLGYESFHNKVYWNNQNYIGIGAGAHGYINNIRYNNEANTRKYISGTYIINLDYLNSQETLENELMLGLRLTKGINISNINSKYNIDILDICIQNNVSLDKEIIIKDGYMSINKDYLYLMNEILIKLIN